jgi:hypothetical protein
MNYDRLNARAQKVVEIIAAGPDSRARTAFLKYWETRDVADLDLGDDGKGEVKELLLSAMVKETGGRFQPGGSDEHQQRD